MGPRDHAGVTFTADIKGEMVIDARNRARTDQIIERCQAGLSIGQMQQGKILGMAVRVARQDVEDLPAQQMPGIDRRIAGYILHQAVALGKGRPAELLIFLLMPVAQGLAEIFLMQPLYLLPPHPAGGRSV